MSSRSLLFVLGTLALVSVSAPRAAHAQTTELFFDSQPGDYIGGGTVHHHTAVDATFTASPSTSGVTSISVIGPDYDFWWYLDFKAAGAAPGPVVGTYETARRYPFSGTLNGLDVSGDGRGCNALTGRFVVLEAEYDSAGTVLKFAADFEQHCEDSVPALFGSIRYKSTISTTLPFGGLYPTYRLTLTPPLHGTVTGDGLTCGTGGSVCVADHSSASTATLDATPDPGYLFAGWGRDCAGASHTSVKINMQKTCAAAFVPLVPDQPRSIAVLMALPSFNGQVLGAVSSPSINTWTLSSLGAGFSLKIDGVGLQPDSDTFEIRPPTGQSFQAGVEYPTVSFPDATHAGLSVRAYSLGTGSCSSPGTMAIREWVAAPGGLPTRFSIDFRLECSGPMVGTLQYAGTYEYGRLAVTPRDLRFKGVADQRGLVSHSADQPFQITVSGPQAAAWELKSDQSWVTASPATAATALTATAKIRNVTSISGAGTRTAHLQVFARGLVNLPEPVTVTLDVTTPDTTSRPFSVFRPASGGWFMPDQGAVQFGLPGDIPLSGDFDGDGTPDIALYRPWTGQWFTPGQPARQWGSPGDIPVPADYNGDGITDLAVFRQSGPSGVWYIFGDPAPRAWGARGDVPVPGDYDGDGLADLAIFRPSTGAWRIQRSATGQTVVGSLGVAGDIPVVADFDGDRDIDLAVFRPSTGFWYITLSAGGTYSRQFGLPGDIPVPLDVTGDGRAELRIWRPATGTWFSFNRSSSQISSQAYGLPGDVPVTARPDVPGTRPADLDGDRRADVTIYRPSTGEWFTRQSATAYGMFTVQPWGVEGDLPVPGDYDGDRRANPAVYHPSTGEWSVRRFNGTLLQRSWGVADDVPVPADYDGDGRIDMAVYRPSSGQWFILTSASDYGAALTLSWGLPGDRPVPADFDGDGRADAAIYRPSTGEWFVAPSSGGWFVRQWGLPGDLPIARDFDGDGRADLAVFRPATGEWFVLDPIAGTLVLTRQWGLSGDVPAADDYDGDGVADVGVYRPSSGEWFVIRSSDGSVLQLQWGLAGDVPITRR
jgi:Divergent InlB B-repeat domain/FG-GAP-like repeat